MLRSDLYAVAALAGAAVVVIADRLQLPIIAATITGAALCFGIRFLAIRFGWRLPSARPPGHKDGVTGGVAEPREPGAGGS